MTPEQVGVREEEADADGRERRQAEDLPLPHEHEREREEAGHREPRPRHPELEARGGREEEREEDDVRRAEVHGAALAGDGERDRDLFEEARLFLDDVARRAEGDGPDVHPRHDRRDERDPPELLEERDEPETREREGRELRDVRHRAHADELEAHAHERRQPGDDDEQVRPADPHDGQREPDRGHERRQDEQRDHREIGAVRKLGQALGERAVGHESCEQPRERERAPAADQYGGCSAHQGPSALKAFQNVVFAAWSSSEASMSGVTSTSTVGVKRWSVPTESVEIGSASGK